MKVKIIPILIIFILLTVGVFGSVNHTTQNNCLVSLMSGEECPPVGSSIIVMLQHFSGMNNFTNFIIVANSSLLLLSILLFLVSSRLSQATFARHIFSYLAYHKIAEFPFIILRKNFLRWLAVHYRRNPHTLYWVYNMS